jgi:hypothetical protein
VHAVAARLGCGAGLEHLDRAPRVLLVVEREGRAHEDAPAVPRRDLLHLGDGSGAGGDLDYSPAPLAHCADQRVEFADVADRRRHRDAAVAGMIERIGGAEPDRALLHRLGHQAPHLGHFIGGRLFADRGVLAHHGGAHGGMPDKDCQIGVGGTAPDGREIFGERLEFPVDAGAQRVEIHAFDDREVAHDQIAQWRRARDDAETAVSHHRRGHAERRRRRQGRVPGDLGVIVGVYVDDAGYHGEAARVDHLGGLAAHLADRGDPRITDRNVGAVRVAPEPVDNRGTTDQQIVHPGPPPAMSGARR